jgi:tetratricopeptide (TPR) repeat protein
MKFVLPPRSILPGLATLGAASLLALATPGAAAVSSAVGKPLQSAAGAIKSGNTGAAMKDIDAARAAAKTPEERQKVSEMAAYVYTRAGQFGKAAAELEAVGAPPKQLAALYYQAGQYDKAIANAKKAGGEDMQVLIAQSYTHTGRAKDAVATYEALIKANGPKPVYLENLAGAQYKSGDKAGYIATTTKLIKVDSSPARWKTLLVNVLQNTNRAEARLAVFYLMQQTGAIDRSTDWLEFSKLALVNNQPGTAQGALPKAGDLSADPMSAKLLGAATQRQTAAMAAAPKNAANPATAMLAGGAYLGAGQYPQAVAAYATAAKGTGPNVDQAKVYGGIAQAKAGNMSAAKALFAGVDPKGTMKDAADIWTLYASTKG